MHNIFKNLTRSTRIQESKESSIEGKEGGEKEETLTGRETGALRRELYRSPFNMHSRTVLAATSQNMLHIPRSRGLFVDQASPPTDDEDGESYMEREEEGGAILDDNDDDGDDKVLGNHPSTTYH